MIIFSGYGRIRVGDDRASVWGRVVQAGKAGRDVFRKREQWKLDMKEQDMARDLEVLGIAAINGKGEHMRQERRACQKALSGRARVPLKA